MGKKLSDRRGQGVLIGYSHDKKCYKILTKVKKHSGTVLYRRYEDCTFDEKSKLPHTERARMRSTMAEAQKLAKALAKAVPGADAAELGVAQEDDHDDGEASEADADDDKETGSKNATDSKVVKKKKKSPPAKVKKAKKKPKDINLKTKIRKVTKKESKRTCKNLAKYWQVPIAVLQRLNSNLAVDTVGNSRFKEGTDLVVPDQELPLEMLAFEIRSLQRAVDYDVDTHLIPPRQPKAEKKQPKRGRTRRGADEEDFALIEAAIIDNKATELRVRDEATQRARMDAARQVLVEEQMAQLATEQARTGSAGVGGDWQRACTGNGHRGVYGGDASNAYLHQQCDGRSAYYMNMPPCDGYVREDSYLTEDTEYMFNLQLGGIRKPKGWNDAHSAANPNSDDWTQAEDAEMEALKSKYTTVSLDEPRLQAKPVGRGMWQYAVKIDKLKARWCFDGSVQGDVPDDISAQVLRYSTARMLMIKGVHHGNDIRVSDVSNAFLHHPCERFYMHHPPGRGQKGTCMAFEFCLYGRREAPMGWQLEVESFMKGRGFTQSISDPCHWSKKGDRPDLDLDVGVFVDDFLMQGPTRDIDELEEAMLGMWPVKHMGDVSKPGNTYLGMNVTIDRVNKILEINQQQSIQKFVQQQGLENAHPLSLPMQKATKLVRTTEKCSDKALLHEFRSCVGSIMHYAVVSRPDIAFAAIKLARLQLYCSAEHLAVAKNVVRYLKGTSDKTLKYSCARDPYSTAVAASDSDWAEGEDSKSTSGNVYMMCEAALTWMCTTQRSVAHSSCEAEYVALDDMAREIVSIRQQIKEFRMDQVRRSPILVLEDNQSAIALAKSKKTHGRTKHIEVRYHYVRELIRDHVLTVDYQPSENNPADLFTKQLGSVLFVKHRETVMGHAPIQGVQQHYD